MSVVHDSLIQEQARDNISARLDYSFPEIKNVRFYDEKNCPIKSEWWENQDVHFVEYLLVKSEYS